MKTHAICTAVLAAGLLLQIRPVSCHAQLIQVRPGYVRAPFVRVQRYPDGGSYVRAPFVARYTPGVGRPGRYAIPAPVQTAAPTETQLSDMQWPALRSAVRDAAQRLDRDLEGTSAGETWRTRLHPGLIRDLVVADVDGPPSPDIREQLTFILDGYDAALAAGDAATVTGLVSFRTVHVGLGELMTPPAVRSRRQLVSSAQQLHDTLGRLDNGAGWQDYLALPADFRSTESDTAPRGINASERAGEDGLAELHRRFESVNGNPDYRVIAALESFKKMRRRLSAYVQFHGVAPTANPHHEEGKELLPTPTPIR